MLSPLKTLKLLGAGLLLISVNAFGQGLPSSAFDDYDQARYQQILNDTQNRYRAASDILQRANYDLQNAQNNEMQIRRSIEQRMRDLDINERREREISDALVQNRTQVEQAKRSIDQNNKDITTLQVQLNDAKSSSDRMRVIADGAKSELDRINSELTTVKKIVEQKQAAVNTANDNVVRQEAIKKAILDDLQKPHTPEEILVIKKQLDDANAQLNSLKVIQDNANKDLTAAQASASSKQKEFDSAKVRNDAAQTEFAGAQKRVTDTQNQLNAKKGELERNNKIIADGSQNENKLNQQLRENRDRTMSLRRDLDHLRMEHRRAIDDVNQRIAYQRQAQGQFDQASYQLNIDTQRMNQVNSNVSQAQQSMTQLASSDAGNDGREAGQQLGQKFGQANGARDGENTGRSEGISAGQDREYTTGMNKGIVDARKDAKSDSMKKPSVNQRGSAFDTGKRLGDQEGYQNSYNKAKYAEGRKRGLDFGLKRAIEDAKVEEPKGYTAQEQTYLNTQLNEVSIGETAIRSGGAGSQSRIGGIPDGEERRYFAPKSPTQYEARLNQLLSSFYLPAYNSAFYSTFDQVGSAVYTDTYTRAEAIARQNAFDREFAKSYPQSEKDGHDEAYLGYAIGNEIGSDRKGFDVANAEAYNANLAIEQKKAFQAGVERANNLYLNNAVIRVEEISLVESDRDGVYRPGETVQVVYKIKNFGHVAKSDLVVDSAVQSGDATVVETRVNSPAIPAVSFATVTGRQQIRINESAADGSGIQLLYRLADSREVARQVFNKTVQFPTVTTLAGFDGVIVPNEATKVNVQLTNRSKSVQALSVVLTFDGSKVTSDTAQINVDKLNAGETKTVTFTMTGKQEARFEESAISVAITQNGLLFGQTGSVVTIIKRHQPTADSIGLIISKNLARGGGKGLFAKAKLDTWDLRVDGVIGATQLANYAGKAVHVMADAEASMDAGSAAALTQFVIGGGQVVIWGSDLDQSSMLSQLGAVALAKANRSASLNENIGGSSTLAGLAGSYNGQAGIVAANGLKVRSVLSSRLGVVGVQSFAQANQRDQKVGRVYTLAIDAASVAPEFVTQLNSLIQSMATPFSQKLDAASKDARWVNMLLLDIQEEVLFSENESKNIYNDKKNNKIFKALEKMVEKSSNGDARNQFANGYKFIADTGSRLSISGPLNNVMDYTTAGGFFTGKTWKTLFCNNKENYNSEYCKTNNGGSN